MRRVLLISALFSAASVGLVAADLVGSDTLLMHLRHDRSNVQWLADSAVVGDFDGDAMRDTAVLGVEGKGVVVAVGTHGADGGVHVQYLPFAIDRGVQAAICALPARLETHPLSCADEDGALPGCRDKPAAQGLSLVDDECVSIHMYWDHGQGAMAWWWR